ncbi:hypothetical protein ACH3XW_17975 [Acanthocheilonema viteae]
MSTIRWLSSLSGQFTDTLSFSALISYFSFYFYIDVWGGGDSNLFSSLSPIPPGFRKNSRISTYNRLLSQPLKCFHTVQTDSPSRKAPSFLFWLLKKSELKFFSENEVTTATSQVLPLFGVKNRFLNIAP